MTLRTLTAISRWRPTAMIGVSTLGQNLHHLDTQDRNSDSTPAFKSFEKLLCIRRTNIGDLVHIAVVDSIIAAGGIAVDWAGPPLGVPPELFLEICHFAVCGQSAVYPLLLGKICRSWRHVCYSTPSLWTRPQLKLDADSHRLITQLRLLEAWLERAGHLPLTLTIYDPHLFQARAQQPCPILLNILVEKASQIKSLSLNTPSLILRRDTIYIPSKFDFIWPILSSLRLSTGASAPDIFDDCPRLTELNFGRLTSWRRGIKTLPWIPWTTLLHVDLAHLASDDLMRLLRWAPNLETLRSEEVVDNAVEPFADDVWEVDEYLTGQDTPPPELMITHQNLKHWSFSQKDQEYLFQAFQNMQLLRLPALKSLKLEWGSTWEDGYPYNHLAQATAGWGCELEELDVWLGGFEEESLMEWIETEQLSSLRRLTLHWEYHSERFSSDLFEAMTATPENDPILPNLEFLFIEDTPLNVSADVVIGMLASRWNDGADFPLSVCMVNVRSPNSDWDVTEEQEAILGLWRGRGYKIELKTSEWTGEED